MRFVSASVVLDVSVLTLSRRNACVNLGIDPDTADGVTKNVRVWLDGNLFDPIVPTQSLLEIGLKSVKKVILDEIGGDSKSG